MSWPPSGTKRVLFVGNSLTYTNSLPKTVASIARAAGTPLETLMAAGADLALMAPRVCNTIMPEKLLSGRSLPGLLSSGAISN
ncbi:MAG: hypothetical protein V4558_09110 [Gemmatimonadota bacterium]